MTDSQDEVAILVSVDPERFEAAERALSDAGVTVDQRLLEIGTIGGRVREDRLNGLRELEGVLAVEAERVVQLAPPDSEVQ